MADRQNPDIEYGRKQYEDEQIVNAPEDHKGNDVNNVGSLGADELNSADVSAASQGEVLQKGSSGTDLTFGSGGGSGGGLRVENVVEDHGAEKDGGSDQSDHIQDAVDAADPGGIVYFPQGRYGIGTTIDLSQKFVILMGDGGIAESTDLTSLMTGNNAMFFGQGSGTHAVFRDIWFRGEFGWGGSYGVNQKAIRQKNGMLEVRRCQVTDTPATGIGTDVLRNGLILNNRIQNCGSTSEIVGSNGIGIGIGIGRNNVLVMNNYIQNTGQYGILYEATRQPPTNPTQLAIAFNYCEGDQYGIGVEAVDGCQVIGNTVEDSTEIGIHFGRLTTNNDYGMPYGNYVAGNTVIDTDGTHFSTDPVWIEGAVDTTLQGNVYPQGGLTDEGIRTISAAWSTDAADPSTSTSETGTASSAGSNTLSDSSKSWTTDEWVGYIVNITSGQGSDWYPRRITGNDATTLTVGNPWRDASQPPSSSDYEILKRWEGEGREGVQVRDTTAGADYKYISGSWV